jgi:phenylacetaldehyde dehydrogenase
VASAKHEDVERAATAAREAFEKRWLPLPPFKRAAYLLRLADLIIENLEEIAQLEAYDMGKPVRAASSLDIPFSAEICRYYAGWATKLSGRTFDLALQSDPYHSFTLRQPVGVAAGIIPWNYPFGQAICKIAPALASGCTIILKPAEQTPLTALRLGSSAKKPPYLPVSSIS